MIGAVIKNLFFLRNKFLKSFVVLKNIKVWVLWSVSLWSGVYLYDFFEISKCLVSIAQKRVSGKLHHIMQKGYSDQFQGFRIASMIFRVSSDSNKHFQD